MHLVGSMPIFAELSAEGWAIIIGAVCVGVGGIVSSTATIIIGYFDRQRQAVREEARRMREITISQKLDDNTAITRKAEQAAGIAAEKAESAVAEKTLMLEDIKAHVNGGLAAALDLALEPLRKQMREHEQQDEATMRQTNVVLRDVLEALRRAADDGK